ncbi:hypothetical protein JOB18_012534 [Solea senegalensis]|uniref:Uncharacterized protein n=1 Tax=Solea senegalensis TaxID=28829 RepID=A0AAV6QRX6_SOLSE|nr:hypothetical protein JOB18_012534 [Solea senegalensis]
MSSVLENRLEWRIMGVQVIPQDVLNIRQDQELELVQAWCNVAVSRCHSADEPRIMLPDSVFHHLE